MADIRRIKKDKRIGFWDIETYQGFGGSVAIVGFSYLNKQYQPFRTAYDFFDFLKRESATQNITVYGFNSSRFDFSKAFDEAVDDGMDLSINDMKFSGSIPFYISLRFPDICKVVRFKDLRAVFRMGSLDVLSKELLGMGKTVGYDSSNITEVTKELIEYNKQDIKCTEGLYKYVADFFETDSVTTSASLSFKHFSSSYGMRNIRKKYWRRGSRTCYYGGRTEVFKVKAEEPFNCYDVNSLYPFAMANNAYPVGKLFHDRRTINKEGFSIARIAVPNVHIPIPPCKIAGKLLFPYGTLYGAWTNSELRFMRSHGYEIEILKSWVADETEFIFTKYINKIYAARLAAKAQKKENLAYMYKLVMNGLYGKFGKKKFVQNTSLRTHDEMIKYKKRGSVAFVKHGIPYYYVRTEVKPPELYYDYVIASHITSNARQVLYDYMCKAGENNMIYADTDSCMCYGNVLDNYVSDEMGAMKLEYTGKRGTFMLPKVYAIEKEDGKKIVKVKGFEKDDGKNPFLTDAQRGKLADKHNYFFNSIINLKPFEDIYDRIYGIRESIHRHSGGLFGFQAGYRKSVEARYDKRKVLPDGIETEPLEVMCKENPKVLTHILDELIDSDENKPPVTLLDFIEPLGEYQ